MANIKVELSYPISDGFELKFRSPVDCSQITGLIVYYPGDDGITVSKEFTLADAHGNNVGNIDHLFAEDVVVKVILDITKGMAFVQNADTNAYLEAQLASKAPNGFGLGRAKKITVAELNTTTAPGWYFGNDPITAGGITANYWYLHVSGYADGGTHCTQILHLCVAYNPMLKRTKRTDSWEDWRAINPRMALGVEYATIELYNGEKVYSRLVDCGLVPADGGITVNVSGIDRIIRYSATIKPNETKILPTDKTSISVVSGTDYFQVMFMATGDEVGKQAYCQVWYIKK